MHMLDHDQAEPEPGPEIQAEEAHAEATNHELT
jgi:hypothetical protein